jgi:hypothetical protein
MHQSLVGTIHHDQAASGDVTVDGGEATEDDVEEHAESVLTNPVPGRVKVAGLERVEDRHDTVEIGLAMLLEYAVDAELQGDVELLLRIGQAVAFAVVLAELLRASVSSDEANDAVDAHSQCRRCASWLQRRAGPPS